MRLNLLARAFLVLSLIAQNALPAKAYTLYGLQDKNSATVLPCQYVYVFMPGHNLYLAEKSDAGNPAERSFDCLLLDGSGKEINLPIPAGYTLSQLYLPQERPVGEVGKTVPADTIMQIHGPKGFGLADMKGNILLAAEHEDIGWPNQGCFPVRNSKKEEMLVFDKSSGNLKKVPGLWLEQSNAALVPVQVGGNGLPKYGYMKRTGEMIIAPKFQEAEEFAETGLAKVRIWPTKITRDLERDDAFIDRSGKIVSPVYREAFAFNGSCAPVCYDDKWGLVDSKFRYTLEPTYYIISPALPDIFAAQLSEISPLLAIDNHGKMLFPFPENTSYVERAGDLIRCHINGKPGEPETLVFIDRTGKVVEREKAEKPQALSVKAWESEHFTKSVWSGSRYRTNEFAFLLKDHNLIKMSKPELISLLGNEFDNQDDNCLYYNLRSGPCHRSWCALKFEFDPENKVKGWRLRWFGGREDVQSDLITTDVIVDPSYKGKDGATMAAPLGFKAKPQ